VSAVLKINGTEKTFDEGLPSNVSELLTALEIDAATVVAEIDGRIIERKDFEKTTLNEAQSIELIRFVGGG
jgi:thiamine biosynthesis protein ThiS